MVTLKRESEKVNIKNLRINNTELNRRNKRKER